MSKRVGDRRLSCVTEAKNCRQEHTASRGLIPDLLFLASRFFPGHFGAAFPSLGQSNRYSLLSARCLFARTSAFQGSSFALVQRTFDFLGRFLARSRHRPSLQERPGTPTA